MTDIVTERSGAILQVQLNRPSKKNAMTSAMYITMADLLNESAKDDHVRAVLWHGGLPASGFEDVQFGFRHRSFQPQ